jgi:5-methylcytosine-specific restriction endonuclease McrA
MDKVYDTGKWVLSNLPLLTDRRKLEREQICPYCNHMGFIKSMIQLRLEDVPRLLTGFFHPRCAEKVFEENQKTCEMCGNTFFTKQRGTEYAICHNCNKNKTYQTEYKRLLRERYRARENKLPDTITLPEWLETLDYFGWACAYCGHKPFVALEHFVPITRGGGTTRGNCVPSCHYCNSRKHARNPHDTDLPNIHLIESYLLSRT